MVFKSFRINCIIRILFIAASCFLFFYLLFKTRLYAALLITGILVLYQIYSLIHYIEKTNRDLARFFESIKYQDFSQRFDNNKLGPSFASLQEALSKVADAFRKARAEKEEHYRYLQTVVQHVGIGLIAFQPDGKVELINTAAKRLLKIARLKNVKSLEGKSKALTKTLLHLKSREKALVKIEDNNELSLLALYATEFMLGGRSFSVVSLQNIHSELE